MFYLLYGTDKEKARAKLRALVDAMLAKKKDASLTRANAESFEGSFLEGALTTQGLFEARQIVVFDYVFESKDAQELIVERRKDLAGSENIFFILEGELDKATLTKLEKYAERAEVFGERMVKGRKEERFNTFALADALGSRDKKKLWTLFIKGKRANIAVEEMHGVLFWQVKSMLLALSAEHAGGAGLNPFVYKKARSFSKNYSAEELRDVAQTLVALSHDARRGKHDFATAFERFILTV